MICISQAKQNGWETWFSCEMGAKLAGLKAPLSEEKVVNLHKEYEKAKKAAKKAAEELAKTPEKGAPTSKYFGLRKGLANGTKRYLEVLERFGAGSDNRDIGPTGGQKWPQARRNK